jgi:hypothetical protein
MGDNDPYYSTRIKIGRSHPLPEYRATGCITEMRQCLADIESYAIDELGACDSENIAIAWDFATNIHHIMYMRWESDKEMTKRVEATRKRRNNKIAKEKRLKEQRDKKDKAEFERLKQKFGT